MRLLWLFFVSFSALAQTNLDARLEKYVSDFGLKPLRNAPQVQPALLKLGEMLFSDTLLSGNNNIACVDCHNPQTDTHDALPLSLGEGAQGLQTVGHGRQQLSGHVLPRNTPALFNLSGLTNMFWDGRVSLDPTTGEFTTPDQPLPLKVKAVLKSALAAQALFPIATPEEMRGQPGSNEIANATSNEEAWELVVARLMNSEIYRKAFATAFPGETINIGHVGEALAAFQGAHFHFNDTPFDRWLKGDKKALSEIQKKGMDVFFDKGNCGACHQGEMLTTEKFESIAVPQVGPGKNNGDDLGRGEVNHDPLSKWAFRVPPLRNVSLTAPYMHNGTFKTIAQVIEHYDDVATSLEDYQLVNNLQSYRDIITGHDHSLDAERLATVSKDLKLKLGFLEEEEKALAEFINGALTDYAFLNRELTRDYTTYFRLGLLPSGHAKLKAFLTRRQHTESHTTWYYFDVFSNGAYFLRELERPMRLYIVKDDQSARLVWREQLHKKAASRNGVVMDGDFVDERPTDLSLPQFAQLEAAYLDIFNRIYQYNDGTTQREIPPVELDIIKHDLEAINHEFHSYAYAGEIEVSDRMNFPIDQIVYAPTSSNTKDVMGASINVQGQKLLLELQQSQLRDELGGHHTTFALELRGGKVTKAQYQAFTDQLLNVLLQAGLTASDVGGSNPSPSKLTEKVINQAYGNL